MDTVLIPQLQLVKNIVLIFVMSTCLGQGFDLSVLVQVAGGRQETAEFPQLLSDGTDRGTVPQIMEEILMEFSRSRTGGSSSK